MKVLVLEDHDTVEIRLPSGAAIYINEHEKGGFQILGETIFQIEPKTENSFRLVTAPSLRKIARITAESIKNG